MVSQFFLKREVKVIIQSLEPPNTMSYNMTFIITDKESIWIYPLYLNASTWLVFYATSQFIQY